MENSNVPNGRRAEAEAAGGSSTITIVEESAHANCSNANNQNDQNGLPILKLRLQKPKNDKKVQWTETTVDNEDLNRRKSKCCCIYKKARKFGESSSSEDENDDCENCRGHVEMKKAKHQQEETPLTQDNQSEPTTPLPPPPPSQPKSEPENQPTPLPPS